ncbi:MAG: hypothetical protein MK005_13390 [Alcanivorax sp.]|nr:hypothetical protein [Alcanivorax sp.]
MNDFVFYSGFALVVIFIACISFFIEKVRRGLDEDIGFIKLWWMIGCMDFWDGFDVGGADRERIVSAYGKIKRSTIVFAFFMVAFSLFFETVKG